ncbi:hypothetical protein F4808DRAFT_315206 [Astrocystis sublimbata]|nr:hypothetical protein F4808DRAFT_315206 [Astrocystis sublimbata]
MSYSPQILMSTAYHIDLPSGGGRGSPFPGVHPGLFRPPTSPSVSSSTYLGQSTGSLQSNAQTPITNPKRKRIGPRASTPVRDWTMTRDGNTNIDPASNGRSYFDLRADEKERRYTLAGQIETPSAGAQKDYDYMEDSIYSDIDYRRALGSKRSRDDADSPAQRPMSIDSHNQITTGWSSFAISTIGGVVGRVWEFCKTGAFLGFYAGGGRGYGMRGEMGPHSANPHDDRDPGFLMNCPPQSEEAPFYYERGTPESTPPPAAKRRQISYGTPTDDLLKNWVMVDEPANVTQQPSLASRASSRRPASRATAPSLTRRISKPVSRLSIPAYNRHPPTPTGATRPSPAPISVREPASFASTRSPVPSPASKAHHSPSKIPVPSRAQSPSSASYTDSRFSDHHSSRIPSPSPYSSKRGHQHRRSQSAVMSSAASVASSISPVKSSSKRESLHEMHDNSPRLDAKARNLAAKRMKDEMETDMRINDFNVRLKDMIRQGKEALGTMYEVEVDDGDRGRGDVDPWESE